MFLILEIVEAVDIVQLVVTTWNYHQAVSIAWHTDSDEILFHGTLLSNRHHTRVKARLLIVWMEENIHRGGSPFSLTGQKIITSIFLPLSCSCSHMGYWSGLEKDFESFFNTDFHHQWLGRCSAKRGYLLFIHMFTKFQHYCKGSVPMIKSVSPG